MEKDIHTDSVSHCLAHEYRSLPTILTSVLSKAHTHLHPNQASHQRKQKLLTKLVKETPPRQLLSTMHWRPYCVSVLQ